jgi:hypothetical protein
MNHSLRTARAAVVALAASAALVGLPALFAPRSFYDDFPWLRHWVDLLPPYNQHLVTDVGELYVGFAIVFAWAAWRPTRDLVLAACAGWTFAALGHFIFHATHLDNFSTGDAIAELVSLFLVLILPGGAVRGVLQAERPIANGRAPTGVTPDG